MAGINNQVEFDNREVEKTEREREIDTRAAGSAYLMRSDICSGTHFY